MLHSIKHHLESLDKPIPKLELPCMLLFGKEGTKGKPLHITAQVMLTFLLMAIRSLSLPLSNLKVNSIAS